MSKKRGDEGEREACIFLESLGYIIIATNWRFHHAEIDIIAEDKEEIVFVEVKRRKNNYFGYPESYVTKLKAIHLRSAIEGYMMQNDTKKEIRLDIIAITDHPFEIKHVKNIDLP